MTGAVASPGKDRRQPDAFIGAERTLKELAKGGCTRKRVGLVVEKGAPARGKWQAQGSGGEYAKSAIKHSITD